MASPLFAGSLTASAQSSLMQSRQDHILRQIQPGEGNQADARIEKGAKEFESMLLGSWLQQAEQSMATVPGAEDDEDASGREQMMSLGVQSLSTPLASSGGIGIASMIAKAMHKEAEKADPGAPPPAGSEETVKIHRKN